MQQRNHRLPAGAKDPDERRRRDHERTLPSRPAATVDVTGRRPAKQLTPENEARPPVLEDERTVGKVVERRLVMELPARVGVHALGVELRVDRVGPILPTMKLAPDREEPNVVLPPTERARPVPGGERGRFIEKEQLGERAGLHQWSALPVAKLEPAGNPALAVVAAADAPGHVVEAAAVPVDQAPRRVGDELAERCDAVLQRHGRTQADCPVGVVQKRKLAPAAACNVYELTENSQGVSRSRSRRSERSAGRPA